jgi:hypothetical protein
LLNSNKHEQIFHLALVYSALYSAEVYAAEVYSAEVVGSFFFLSEGLVFIQFPDQVLRTLNAR